MKVLRSLAITWVITIVFAAGLVVRHSEAAEHLDELTCAEGTLCCSTELNPNRNCR